MKLHRAVLVLAAVAASGCLRDTTAPAQTEQAFVGFPSAVDTLLLRRAGLTILEARAVPPAARVSGTPAALDGVASNPAVSYVLTLYQVLPGDSLGMFLRFLDHPTTADTLTDADRALVASVGARIVFVYTVIPDIAVRAPVWAVPALRTDTLVTGLDIEGPGPTAQGRYPLAARSLRAGAT